MPIMIMQTLCEQDIVNIDYNNDPNKCYDAATGMLFLYSTGFHAVYWTFAARKLREASASTLSQSQLDHDLFSTVKHVLSTPALIGVYLGIVIGLISPLRYGLFESESLIRSVGSSIKTLGQPVVSMQTLIMAASLGHLEFYVHRKNDVSDSGCSSLCSLGRSRHAGLTKYAPLGQTEEDKDDNVPMVGSVNGDHNKDDIEITVISQAQSKEANDPESSVNNTNANGTTGRMDSSVDETSSGFPSGKEIMMMVGFRLAPYYI
jgi:hypothetical protein